MLANLRALFFGVVDIILFRRGPENLPASQTLLAIVLLSSVLLSAAMSSLVALPPTQALARSVVGSAVMLLWFRATLTIAGKRERFLQTATAIAGVNTLFLPALVPLAGALMPYLEKADPGMAPPAALMLLTTVVSLWGFVVEVRIVKAAFDCPWVGAILLVIGEFFAAVFVSTLLFGIGARAASQA